MAVVQRPGRNANITRLAAARPTVSDHDGTSGHHRHPDRVGRTRPVADLRHLAAATSGPPHRGDCPSRGGRGRRGTHDTASRRGDDCTTARAAASPSAPPSAGLLAPGQGRSARDRYRRSGGDDASASACGRHDGRDGGRAHGGAVVRARGGRDAVTTGLRRAATDATARAGRPGAGRRAGRCAQSARKDASGYTTLADDAARTGSRADRFTAADARRETGAGTRPTLDEPAAARRAAGIATRRAAPTARAAATHRHVRQRGPAASRRGHRVYRAGER